MNNQSILIVDDYPDIRLLLRNILVPLGYNLDDIIRLKFVIKRCNLTIYLSADTSIADFCVNMIGEIYRRCPNRQFNNFALRRDCKDSIL